VTQYGRVPPPQRRQEQNMTRISRILLLTCKNLTVSDNLAVGDNLPFRDNAPFNFPCIREIRSIRVIRVMFCFYA
jgi:hypothetical protein